MSTPSYSKRELARHALFRGGIVCLCLLFIGLVLPQAFFLGLPSKGDALRILAVAVGTGAVGAGKWYWEATGGEPF